MSNLARMRKPDTDWYGRIDGDAGETPSRGAIRFAVDVEMLADRLQPSSVWLNLYQIDFEGLSAGQARSVMRDVAGNFSLWHEASPSRFLMLLIGDNVEGSDGPMMRLAGNLRTIAGETRQTAIRAHVRRMRQRTHEIVSGLYLLRQLAAEPPRTFDGD